MSVKRTPPKNQSKSQQNINQPIADVEMTEENHNHGSPDNPSIKDLMKLMKSVDAKVSTMDNKLSNHINIVSKEIARIDETVATHTAVIASNTGEIGELRNKIGNMETKSDALTYSHELNKQLNIRFNVTVTGVPYTAGENLTELALAVFDHIGASVTANDIASVYRLKYGTMFVVKFKSFETKAAVMEAKSNVEILLSDIVGESAQTSNSIEKKQIYINTHVIPYFGRILSHGRRAVKEKRLHSCWMTNNGVVAKLTNESKESTIQSIDQLYQFCGKPLQTAAPSKANTKNKRTAAEQETSPIDIHKQNKKPANMS